MFLHEENWKFFEIGNKVLQISFLSSTHLNFVPVLTSIMQVALKFVSTINHVKCKTLFI